MGVRRDTPDIFPCSSLRVDRLAYRGGEPVLRKSWSSGRGCAGRDLCRWARRLVFRALFPESAEGFFLPSFFRLRTGGALRTRQRLDFLRLAAWVVSSRACGTWLCSIIEEHGCEGQGTNVCGRGWRAASRVREQTQAGGERRIPPPKQ